MRIVLSAASAAIVIALIACGSSGNGSGGTLDCTWVDGDNCYKTTLAAAMCMDVAGDGGAPSGVLSADGSTCTYANGKVVTFNPPITLPIPNSSTWSFTITMNGAMCMQYHTAPDQGFQLTTSAGTVSESEAHALTISCPNGTSYSTSGPASLGLLKCEGGLTELPGYSASSSATSVNFGLLGFGGPIMLDTINCQR